MYENAKRLERIRLDLTQPNLNDEARKELTGQLVETKTWFFNQSDNMLKIFSRDLSIKTLR